jgi:spermidine synthase
VLAFFVWVIFALVLGIYLLFGAWNLVFYLLPFSFYNLPMTRVIPLAYSALGAFSMVVQTILLREFFVVAAGNEISFGIAMAGWLLGVGAGSMGGAFFSARRPSTAAAFAWASLAMCAVAPLLLAAVRCLHILGAMPQGGLLPLARTFYLIPLLTVPFSAVSGFAFPLAARLRPLPALKIPAAMAGAYAWECLGALVAGLLYTFWLVGKLDPLLIIALFALPLLFAAGVTSLGTRGRLIPALIGLALFLDLAAMASGSPNRGETWLTGRRWQGISSATLVASRDSKFQNLQLGFAYGQFSLFANGQLAAVFPDDEGQMVLAAQIISQHPRPGKILVIGDVFGGLAKQLLRYPITSLTAVEIDARFTDMVREHLGAADREALNDPRLRSLSMDGRRFVLLSGGRRTRERERFDLVFIHQPDAWTARANRYYTREFFLDLKKILAPGGVVALRIASGENYFSEIVSPYTAVIYRTLKSVFPAIAVSPGMTSAFFASSDRSSVSQDPAVLARRYRALAPPPAVLETIFASLYPEEKTSFLSAALQKQGPRGLNRDQKPIAYFLGSRLLGWSSGSPLSGMFDLLQRSTLASVLLLLALLLLPVILSTLLRRKNNMPAAPVMLAAASGGFAGLSFEITAIFIFQNSWGFVYRAVGMLIALFMLGLGAGAAWTRRRLENRSLSPARAARWLAGVQLLIAALNLTCLPLLRLNFRLGWPGQVLLAVWLGGMGLLVGAILPLGMRALGRLPSGLIAGLLNAGDYLGGAIGSLFMAAFFLPLLGTGNSLLVISSLSLVSAALLLRAAAVARP